MIKFSVRINGLNDSTLDTRLTVTDQGGAEIGDVEVTKNDEGLFVYDFKIQISGKEVHIVATSRTLDSGADIEYDATKTSTPGKVTSFRR